eukprot:TRINITY_DN15328_c0_g1_i1.p1 TRINITY_DN15328_c0_g1~~TRINITY_DN15328_c0_g1_i1.p1  ORF type:complete len:291 (-),score=42.53 TRINITY_DN15328_c0_g1_i1:25-897(-)
MLCEVSLWGNFFTTWFFLTVVGWTVLMALSLSLFMKFYVNPTYEWWRYKSNPQFPEPAKVKQEITIMTKGLVTATFCPAMALYLGQQGISKAYCGISEQYGWGYHFFTFLLIWIGTDFWEFLYHYCGHKYPLLWAAHKPHHQFYNPSPFAVIADEYLDQFMRALPLLLFPIALPINMDLIFFEYALFFYGYGVYLHWGHEFEYPNAHHPWINTSFQHYIHHAVSVMEKPYHTGFFFKIWDNLFGSVHRPVNGKCVCAKCCRDRGERTLEAWNKVKKPDYSVLLQPSFWLK